MPCFSMFDAGTPLHSSYIWDKKLKLKYSIKDKEPYV
jgi:hypothetical protein